MVNLTSTLVKSSQTQEGGQSGLTNDARIFHSGEEFGHRIMCVPELYCGQAFWRDAGIGGNLGMQKTTADGFENLRSLVDPKRRRGEGRGRMSRPRHAIGRWALMERRGDAEPEFFATTLLDRWGVVFRDLLARETLAPAWRDLLIVLRRMEARGEIRGGLRFGFRRGAVRAPGGGGSAASYSTVGAGGGGNRDRVCRPAQSYRGGAARTANQRVGARFPAAPRDRQSTHGTAARLRGAAIKSKP